MNKSILIFIVLAFFRGLYPETITFNLNDYTFSADSTIIAYKEKVYKKYIYSGYELPVIHNEVRFAGQYADSIKINSISAVLIKPDLGMSYFDGPMNFGTVLPKRSLAVGARGVKRHGGFSVLEESPFFIRLDSLFFINSIDFNYYINESLAKDSKIQIYEKLDMAIITSAQFTDNFEVYKNFKLKQGLNTIIKTVEEIYAEYPGESNVIKIRNFIKDKYNQNDLEFVVIGGGYDIVPVGEAQPYISSQTFPVYADTFYSHLDGDQDGNKNGIYCEMADEPDYYADVYVGRFPGNSEAEINAIINKNMNYYSPARNFRTGFNTAALLLGFGLTDSNPNSGDGRKLCENIRTELPGGFSADTLYEGSSPDFNYQSIMNKLNYGYNLVYSQSHGAVHLIRQINNNFKIWSDQIMNADAVSGLYFIASCDPGRLGEDSFSRKAMISPDGGCVNYIGMSGGEWPWVSNNMNAYFFNGLFRNKTYGQSFADAAIMYGNIESNSTARYLNFGYAFQGDPSNRPFLREPNDIAISSIGQIKKGNGTLTGTFSTSPSDTIFVTLTAGNKIISKTKTISINFSLDYDNLTSDSVFVSYHSQEVFLRTYGYLTAAADQIAFQVTDILPGDSNQSGVVENGESFGISFKFSLNSNTAAIDSLVAKIVSVDHSGVSIINSTKRFKLPGVGSYFNISAFYMNFSSADPLVNDSLAIADLEIQKKDGTKLYSEKIYIPVAVPYLVLQSVNRAGNTIKPKFINNSKGHINLAKIELLEATKSLLPDDRKEFSFKSFVELKNITGYKLVSDSVNFSIDSTKTYKLRMTINNNKIYYSDEFSFSSNLPKPITLYADHSIGKINLEWSHTYEGQFSYNIYSSATENFSTKQQLNFEKIYSKEFSFNYSTLYAVWIKVALVDSNGYEFVSSDPVKVEPFSLYKNSVFRLAPFQLYNPVFVDGKLISNSQNSTIAAIYQNGTLINGTGTNP
jgi:hypothetical protein